MEAHAHNMSPTRVTGRGGTVLESVVVKDGATLESSACSISSLSVTGGGRAYVCNRSEIIGS